MKHITSAFIIASFVALSGCGQEEAATASTNNAASETQQTAALPGDFFLNEEPANTVSLSEARASAQTGDDITFTGYIGGRAEPFTKSRAIFLVADSEKAPPCTDGCPAPWDACCTPNEVITENSATVQVLDAEGQTLRMGLNGQNGLAPGSQVTVVGKVRQANDAVLIVDASGIKVDDNRP